MVDWISLFTAAFFTMIPDFDARTKYHRFFLTHSILIPLPLIFGNYSTLGYVLILSISIHLLLDISFKKKGGKYCIYFWKYVNYEKSTLWLFFNGITGIMLFIMNLNGLI